MSCGKYVSDRRKTGELQDLRRIGGESEDLQDHVAVAGRPVDGRLPGHSDGLGKGFGTGDNEVWDDAAARERNDGNWFEARAVRLHCEVRENTVGVGAVRMILGGRVRVRLEADGLRIDKLDLP